MNVTNNKELRSGVWLITLILMSLVSFVHVTWLAPGERVNDPFELAQMLTHTNKETQHLQMRQMQMHNAECPIDPSLSRTQRLPVSRSRLVKYSLSAQHDGSSALTVKALY